MSNMSNMSKNTLRRRATRVLCYMSLLYIGHKYINMPPSLTAAPHARCVMIQVSKRHHTLHRTPFVQGDTLVGSLTYSLLLLVGSLTYSLLLSPRS